ncbi:uncharacterized protein LOC142235213 [Haematobia irritans]|uniref:uncharacterized protein LOC142235213 n=1 Tax=Haematobia irritans TaxID=7368 RepID=UPI003F4FB957
MIHEDDCSKEEYGSPEVESDENDESDDEDLAASDTSSDEEDEPRSKDDIIRENVLQRYEDRKGKQLFIRFPQKLPESADDLDKLASQLSPLIRKVHKPRQKHARFCLVDFDSKEDRDAAFKALRESIQNGQLEKYAVNIPRTENNEYVKELAERKVKSIENKKAKARLKKASKKALHQKIFTSTVVVLNLPKTASVMEIRQLFPNAVDIQIKSGKGKLNRDKSVASVTLPSTMEARMAVKQKVALSGNELIVKFDNHLIKKKVKLINPNTKRPSGTQEDTTGECQPQPKKAKLNEALVKPNKAIGESESIQKETKRANTTKNGRSEKRSKNVNSVKTSNKRKMS